MGEKILFVDDEPSVLDGFQRLLRREFDVSTALGGYQALALIKSSGPFAVIISDMRMPEMNGAEFLARVREKAPDSVRMLLTGHADLDTAIEAVNRGNIYKFLTKPCDKAHLVDAIESGLALYSSALKQRTQARKAEVIEHARSDWESSGSSELEAMESSGLPGPSEARSYLRDHLGTDRHCHVVMIKLSMLHTVEQRYGDAVASEYLMSAVQLLAMGLHPDDRIYHWGSDTLMVVLKRSGAANAIRMEIGRIIMDSPQHVVEQNGRKTMVAITFSFDLLPVAEFATLNELMDAFKAKPAGVI